MKYSDVIIRSSCPQNRPCCYAGGCVCHRALHKGSCTGRQELGLIPTWPAKCTGCFLVMEPPEGASFSNCRKAVGVLTTALPSSICGAVEKPSPCSSFLQRTSALYREGRNGTGHCVAEVWVARVPHPSVGNIFQLLSRRLSVPTEVPSRPRGNPRPQGAREGRRTLPCFSSLSPHNLHERLPLGISTMTFQFTPAYF